MTLGRERLFMQLISNVIILVLGVQALAGFIGTGRLGWPFTEYHMYHTPHFDGDRLTHNASVFLLLDEGTPVQVRPEDIASDRWLFVSHVLSPVTHGRADKLGPVMAKYCRLYGSAVRGFQLLDSGVAITAAGPVENLAPIELQKIEVQCPKSPKQ